MWMGMKARVADLLERLFVPREMILRANDRVTVIRLPVRTQKLVVLGLVLLIGWAVIAGGALVGQQVVITGKNRAIDEHKLGYFDLLKEVSEYHDQFARITQNLESNQAFLLAMLRKTG